MGCRRCYAPSHGVHDWDSEVAPDRASHLGFFFYGLLNKRHRKNPAAPTLGGARFTKYAHRLDLAVSLRWLIDTSGHQMSPNVTEGHDAGRLRCISPHTTIACTCTFHPTRKHLIWLSRCPAAPLVVLSPSAAGPGRPAGLRTCCPAADRCNSRICNQMRNGRAGTGNGRPGAQAHGNVQSGEGTGRHCARACPLCT